MLYEWDVVGHQKQLSQLEGEIKQGKLTHAYLFSGPRQTGKFRIARILAAILQCPQNYCKTCDICKRVESRQHADTIIMDDEGESIKIDQVRELVRKTSLTSQSKYRIVLIKNIERMPIEAQNSFLKTLEEPPGKTMFIMTSDSINDVLPTIQSRVRHYYFPNIQESVLRKYLQEKFGQNSRMDEIINMAQGRPGLAVRLMQNNEALTHQQSLYNQIDYFLKNDDLAKKFLFVEDISKDPEELDNFLDAFGRYLRKLLFELIENPDHPIRKRFDLKRITELFEYLEKTRYLIQRNINKKLALENLMILTEA